MFSERCSCLLRCWGYYRKQLKTLVEISRTVGECGGKGVTRSLRLAESQNDFRGFLRNKRSLPIATSSRVNCLNLNRQFFSNSFTSLSLSLSLSLGKVDWNVDWGKCLEELRFFFCKGARERRGTNTEEGLW